MAQTRNVAAPAETADALRDLAARLTISEGRRITTPAVITALTRYGADHLADVAARLSGESAREHGAAQADSHQGAQPGAANESETKQ
jgi:hypothetical protein